MQATLSLFCPTRIAAGYPAGPAPITITSNASAMSLLSDADQHARRILETFLDGHEELHRLAAIDDAVIVGEREVHHRPHHHLSVDDHGPVLDLVHAEDRALWRIDDRRRHQRAEHAAVGDAEGAT